MNPYLLLGAGAFWLASTVGGYFYGTHHEGLRRDLQQAKLERDASDLLAQLNATSAAKDAQAAQFAHDKDMEHVANLQAVADGQRGFDALLSQRVRDAQDRARRSCELSRAGEATGRPATAPTGSVDGPGGPDIESGKRLREAALKLQADVKLCWAWAAGGSR